MLVNQRTLNLSRAHGTLGSAIVLPPFEIPCSSGIILTRPDVPHHLPRINTSGGFTRRARQAITAANTRGWSRGGRCRVGDLPPSRRVVLDPRPRIYDNCARPALGGDTAFSPREAEAGSTKTKDVPIGIVTAGVASRRGWGWERRARPFFLSEESPDVLLTFSFVLQLEFSLTRLFLTKTYGKPS